VRRRRNSSERLRNAVAALPHHTKLAMLRGIQANRVIVGAYSDRRGGVCPMLAAHRNGGRTDFGTFARAWDQFTAARRSRRASAREVRTLKGYLEVSLIREGVAPPFDEPVSPWSERPLAEEVREIQASRRRHASVVAHEDAGVTVEDLLAAELLDHGVDHRLPEPLTGPPAELEPQR
jgi:hypothetical protein